VAQNLAEPKNDEKNSPFLCPFHQEKTGSLFLVGDRFHCFGCGETGNVVDLPRGPWDSPQVRRKGEKSRGPAGKLAKPVEALARLSRDVAEVKCRETVERRSKGVPKGAKPVTGHWGVWSGDLLPHASSRGTGDK